MADDVLPFPTPQERAHRKLLEALGSLFAAEEGRSYGPKRVGEWQFMWEASTWDDPPLYNVGALDPFGNEYWLVDDEGLLPVEGVEELGTALEVEYPWHAVDWVASDVELAYGGHLTGGLGT